MKIYVLRHGQTSWNVDKKIQGKQDTELNEVGIRQAYEAKEKFNLLNIDLIMCSPLKRTKKTAEIINQDKNLHIIYKKELIERNLGEFEGKDCETEEGDIYNYYKNESKMKIEPVVELCNRINKLLEDIKNNYKNNTILLVTHSGTTRAIEAYFYGIDKDGELPPENLKNCEIREYEF